MTPYYDHAGCTIYHGDCREVLPTLDPVDLVLTDPPYGVGLDYGGQVVDSTVNHAAHVNWLLSIENGVLVFPLGATCRLAEICAVRKPTWYFVWDKGSPGTRCKVGFNDWELFPVFGWRRELPACHDMIRANAPSPFPNGHPCPKPEKLYRALVGRCSLRAEAVLDPFMGSGTTLRAAKDLGRKAIGIEIEEKYCEIAAKRLEQEVFEFEPDATAKVDVQAEMSTA